MTTSEGNAAAARGAWLLFAAALAFFFVSGACGLLYQVVWTRKLVLLVGSTSYAVSTVLSVFFLGLGLGSLWGGRVADTLPGPLRRYGRYEIIIGLWAIFFIASLAWGEALLVGMLRAVAATRGMGVAVRALLAAALMFVPVFLMGATLPLLAKFVNRDARVHGLRIGLLYTVNTLGAVAGCAAAGFLLLPAFGYTTATLIGAGANVGIGVIAIFLAWNREDSQWQPKSVTESRELGAQYAPRLIVLLFTAFALSGFCTLALEVLWTRLLAIVFLGTTYAYTAMLTTLLCGIAVGSGVAAALSDRVQWRAVGAGATVALVALVYGHAYEWFEVGPWGVALGVAAVGGVIFLGHVSRFGMALLLAGAASVFLLSALAAFPEKIIALHRAKDDWDAVVRGMTLLSFAAVFLPTFCLGMTFPLVVKAAAWGGGRLGRDVGRLYAANTFGGVLGAAAGGFVILPLLGTHWGITTLSMLLVLAGALLVLACPQTHAWRKAAAIILGCVFLAAAWTRAPENVNTALNTGYIPHDHRVLALREGVEGTVAVTEPVSESGGANRVLWINRVQATTSIERGVKMNRFQGVLPLVYDRDPKDVLFMCFGSGITCGTLALHPFERIDAVEISPDVLAVAPLFAKDNLNVMDRPIVAFHIDDGRNYLLTTHRRYDVITFEPMPLALSGVSTFYTREYYDLCRARLAPGGLVSQWVPLHSLHPDLVRALVRTFIAVFPQSHAWFVNADLFLIGSDRPLRIDYATLLARLKSAPLRAALEDAGFPDAPEIVASFLMDSAALAAYAGQGRVMTDDLPWAEFEAPRWAGAPKTLVADAISQIQIHAADPLPLLVSEGLETAAAEAVARRTGSRRHDFEGLKRYYGSQGVTDAEAIAKAFLESLSLDPKNATAQYYLKEITVYLARNDLRGERYADAERRLVEALRYLGRDADLQLLLGDAYFEQGARDLAIGQYRQYLDLGGLEPRARDRVNE